jgi:hypothetical protein
VIPVLAKTLRRWKSMVLGLRNNSAATSRLESSCATEEAICHSWAVSATLVEASRFRAVPPEARSSSSARCTHGSAPRS